VRQYKAIVCLILGQIYNFNIFTLFAHVALMQIAADNEWSQKKIHSYCYAFCACCFDADKEWLQKKFIVIVYCLNQFEYKMLKAM
jgi:hypothetical protein